MPRRLPPLNALRAFEVAARHNSFTGAAEELRVSHAAVSRHVRSLVAAFEFQGAGRIVQGAFVVPGGDLNLGQFDEDVQLGRSEAVSLDTDPCLVPALQQILTRQF